MVESNVHGVIVLARNGDRVEYYQNPKTYASTATETTPLGEVQSHALGQLLREIYLTPGSPSHVAGVNASLVNTTQVHARVKAGGEGTVTFDSAIALLQGLFPPTPDNKIKLASGEVVTAPLGGYQYVPVETVETGNDHSLEPWTDCPTFQKHVESFYASDDFKEQSNEAERFFKAIKDFVFGRPTELENAYNIYDYVHAELTHNQTYAYRLPPTFLEQARGWADYHENGVFSDISNAAGIGNLAGRTILHSILTALERIAFNDDPLHFLLLETTYQAFVSLFHLTEIVNEHPELRGMPSFASALAIELRRGAPPEDRDFLRFNFRNGSKGEFRTVHVFGHQGDIPVTEFIYRTEGVAITSDKQRAEVCGAKSELWSWHESHGGVEARQRTAHAFGAGALACLTLLLLLGWFHKRSSRHAPTDRRNAKHGLGNTWH